MSILLYNSLTHKKEPLRSIQPPKLGLYVCGVTVYDYCHIGHARTYAAFDVLTRYLRYRGYALRYVRNITDIDDKIIKRAQESGESWQLITERFIQAMHEDFAALNFLPPDHEPKATDTIPEIIQLIETLLAKNIAYHADNGDVYYHVPSFESYGKLSHQQLEQLACGARVELNEAKRDGLDFVLWKRVKPGEPSWPSPWGAGRPGWHIECSAMAMQHLGAQFELHGGGSDLMFPHHENEIAQTEAATEQPFVQCWLHTGMVQINREKMSKSLGNFFTIREVLASYQPEVVRYFLISSHYRSQLHYSSENLEQAKQALCRLYTALRGLPSIDITATHHAGDEFIARFCDVMNDDINTPEAIAVLFDLAKTINRLRHEEEASAAQQAGYLAATLRQLGAVLGLLQDEPEQFLCQSDDVATIEALIAARNEARQRRDWKEADRVREQLQAMNVEVEDGPQGTLWRKV